MSAQENYERSQSAVLCAIKSDENEDGSDWIMNSWHPLKELKDLYLLQVSEFEELRGAHYPHNLLKIKPLYFSEREQ